MRYVFALTAAMCASISAAHAEESFENKSKLQEVVVTGTLEKVVLAEVPTSVTVLDEATLKNAGVQHVEDVLGLVPNLNWASGTSRPRFYQLRGIGERDQYQGAPNPSVGFLVDDIDYSGMGMLATLFDVEQFEVLRGPQGTSHGANALAGLIKVKTRDARPEWEIDGEATGAQYGTSSVGAVIGGPLGIGSSENAFRVVAQRYRSDGFRYNDFTRRDDTNGFDELTTRAKLHLAFGADWHVDVLGLYVDQDNGYDAFSIDNSLTTHSDHPGRDAQRSKALEAKIDYAGFDSFTIESISTYAAADVFYTFDDDWGNNAFWASVADYSPYDYYSNFTRRRSTRTQELRFASKSEAHNAGRIAWTGGVYILNLRESNSDLEFAHDVFSFPDPTTTDLLSDYSATNKAVYGQVEYDLSNATSVAIGLRAERRNASYHDTNDTAFSPTDDMWGGNLSLVHRLTPDHTMHATLSRGYKAGGFNIGPEIPPDRRKFDPEYLWNLEVGDRASWFDRRLTSDVTLFYMARRNMQVSSSFQSDPTNPSTFTFVTSNAARGENYGLESSAEYHLDSHWALTGSLALLKTRYLDYRYQVSETEVRSLNGRAQAHAPEYQFSFGIDWRNAAGWMARVDVTGVDSFYFDESNDQRSQSYRLVNARAGYEADKWSLTVWGRNLFDEVYAQRGFYFGVEPPDFPNKLYIQRGDPRQIGVSVQVKVL